MAEPRVAARTLASRLRELRVNADLTQQQLAKALEVSVPLISSWENLADPRVPPFERIAAYARLFATLRRGEGNEPALLPELDGNEENRRQELERELKRLRDAATGAHAVNAPPHAGPWHFTDGAPVTIVAGELPETWLATDAYTDPSSPDYVDLYGYADPDSLVELFGHVRAANPDSYVSFRRASRVSTDHLTTHLVLLGGVEVNELVPEMLAALRVPVRQTKRSGDQGVFEIDNGTGRSSPLAPSLRTENDKRILVEDVGHFCRGPNPYNGLRTVTICNGMFGRGTYGAVRALTDIRFRDRNAAYARSRFPGDGTFSILSRVRVVRGEVVTPDWTRPENVLHEWSETLQ
jgi:transcriptional regulator with XRE-family HTH domain